MIRRALLCAVALACVALVGCSDDTADAPADTAPVVTAPPRPVTGELTVLAEPDLAPAMEAVVPAYQQANPGATAVVVSLEPDEIVARVESGGGDVVALADAPSMDQLEGSGKVAAVVPLPQDDGARAGAVVASTNPTAATRFVELAAA